MNKPLTPDMAYPKIKHYCAYSERCHWEVREKLFTYGLIKKDVEILITRLIEEDCLNETRYAKLFTGSHFRLHKWGRVKIYNALKQKKVSDQNIKLALKEIVEGDYSRILSKLAEQKWLHLKTEQYINRQIKTIAYLMQKGYERPAIQMVINKMRKEKNQ